jgi:hypothetical protein
VRKLIVVACFLGLVAASAMAGETDNYPKTEVFGGYQYSHLEGGVNGNGFDFAFNGNFNNYFGITADLGASYASEGGVSLKNYTYTFGPVLSLRAHKAYTPFVHALIGGDHASASLGNVSVTGNGFALMAGGGVDFNLNRNFSFRAAQADWLMTHANNSTSGKNLRLVTGIVFRY